MEDAEQPKETPKFPSSEDLSIYSQLKQMPPQSEPQKLSSVPSFMNAPPHAIQVSLVSARVIGVQLGEPSEDLVRLDQCG
jgi:hypothetical protein